MKKIRNFFLIASIMLILIVFGTRIVANRYEEFSAAKVAAVEYAETKYPNNEFYVTGIAQTQGNYNVTLKVKNNDIVKLRCYVIPPSNENEQYYVNIWFAQNKEYLK